MNQIPTGAKKELYPMKRLFETDIWSGWLRNLPPEIKCLWVYLLHCDNSGVWIVDYGLAEFLIGAKIEWERAKVLLGERIFEFDNGNKWYFSLIYS